MTNHYKVPGNDEEYFLNPLVNYSFTFESDEMRNDSLYAGSFIKLSYGSLISTELLKDEEIVLNLQLNDKLTLGVNHRNYITRHLNYDKEETKIGFKYNINNYFSFVGDTQLEYGKGLIDVGTGVLVSDSKNNYFSAMISFDDFIYDMKNLNEGFNKILPVSISSKLKYSNSRIYFFSEVNYSTGFDRKLSFDESISEVNHHLLQNCEYKVDLKFEISNKLNLYSKTYFNQFKEEKSFNDTLLTYSMKSDFISIELGINQEFEKSSLKYGIVYSESNQDKEGGYPYDYYYAPEISYNFKVSAFIPYIFYQYKWNEHLQIEPGVLVQLNRDNAYHTSWNDTYLLHLDYNDMLKLGARYKFDDKSFIYASMGHLFNLGKFGGGNVRFVKYF